ncbi:MAG: cytochrome c nitrite reductase small subunit [Phycisphaerae bacterium]|nr:cytochrome c nitrite reductase small subunit [Phycisphaerae bacterium]
MRPRVLFATGPKVGRVRKLNAVKLAAFAGLGLLGVGAGVGAYTFIYAEGASYLTDDAAACANCHVMQEQYRAWNRSSHHAVATCNDCHTPHDFLGKYLVKARNGYHHSLAFTTGWFHEPIQITPQNLAVTEAACRRCHQDIVQAIDTSQPGQPPLSCTRCHPNVGHLH